MKFTVTSGAGFTEVVDPPASARAALELVLFVLEQYVEGRQRTIRPRDVLLKIELVGIS